MNRKTVRMKGITLIELSVALSILAILAAVLLPRMAEMQRAARVGDLRFLHGQVSARVLLMHLAAQARQGRADAAPCAPGGATADNHNTVCSEHGLVAMVHGYPAATPGQTFGLAPTELPTERYRLQADKGRATVMRRDAAKPEACSFTYTQALDARTAAAISSPVVSGC